MIYLFSDFGFNGPYVGQMKSVLLEQAADVLVVDLMHDAPVFNSKASAHLLAASVLSLANESIVLGVVDPGVGSARKGIALYADSRWYVGPDNGLFDVVASRAKVTQCYEITYQNEAAANSFHGRDIFAPVAALLYEKSHKRQHKNIELGDFLLPLEHESLGGGDLFEIIYIDRFGNLMTGVRALHWDNSQGISFAGELINSANTFSDMNKGEAFYYENSQGLIEIAVNCGSAKKVFDAAVGDTFTQF